jgi:transposase
MSANSDTAVPPRKLSIPWDISEWLDKPRLLAHIAEDIDSLDWNNPEMIEFLRENPNFQARFLLILITYAYALGVCESEEVAEVFYRDAELRRLLPGQPPSPRAISRFRRENRGLLKWSITQAIKHALRSRFELGDATLPPGLRRMLSDAAATRIDVGRHMDRSVQAE